MNSLKQILQKYSHQVTLGESNQKLDANALQLELSNAVRSTDYVFNVTIVMLLCIFVAALVIVFLQIWDINAGTVLGTFGISCAGMVLLMARLWKQKTQLRLMLVFAKGADEKVINTLIALLLKDFQKL